MRLEPETEALAVVDLPWVQARQLAQAPQRTRIGDRQAHEQLPGARRRVILYQFSRQW